MMRIPGALHRLVMPSMPKALGTPRFLTRTTAAALVIAATAIACTDMTQPKPQGTTGRVAILANIGAGGASSLTVEVTAPDILKAGGLAPDTLRFQVSGNNGVASGSLDIPVGAARQIMVRAYDNLTETHRGSITTDIAAGTNPTISITLMPLVGDVQINVAIGSTIVTVSPDSVVLEVGDTTRLTAEVRDQNGMVVPNAPVQWVSLNALRASVDLDGLVTMRDTGTVQIVANVGHSGASAIIRGSTHVSAVAQVLIWSGAASQDWNDTTNWARQGGGQSRVPTAADSAIVPTGAGRMPMLNTCATMTVRDLVIETGASLERLTGTSCNTGVLPAIQVTNSAVINGSIVPELRALEQVSLSGSFADLRVSGAGIHLIGDATATRLDVIGVGTAMSLDGKRLRVTGPVNLVTGARLILGGGQMLAEGLMTANDSSWFEMTNAADTLDVRGSLMMGTKSTRTGSLLSAGVLRLGGDFRASARFSFTPTGTHQTIIDGSTVQSIRVDSIALLLGKWQNVRILRNNEVRFDNASMSGDSVHIAGISIDSAATVRIACCRRYTLEPSGGTLFIRNDLRLDGSVTWIDGALDVAAKAAEVAGQPVPLTPTVGGGAELHVAGVLTTGAGSLVNPGTLVLRNVAGTSGVAGDFSPGTLKLVGNAAIALKPALSYQTVQLSGGANATVQSGTTEIGGNLLLNDSSWVAMDNADDTLSVRGNFTVGNHDSRGQWAAGVLRLGGGFHANHRFSFAPSGTHETIIDGTVSQNIQVDSAALNLGRWQNVRVLRNNEVRFNAAAVSNDSVLFANMAVDSAPTLVFGQCCSGRRVAVTPAGGTLIVRNRLRSDFNAFTIAGNLTLVEKAEAIPGEDVVPPTPTIEGNGSIRVTGILSTGAGSSVTIQTLRLAHTSGTTQVDGAFSTPTLQIVNGADAVLKPAVPLTNLELANGSRVAISSGTLRVGGHLTLNDSSWIEMTDPADTLEVRGALTIGTRDTRTGGLLSAGVLRLGGNFTATSRFSFAPSGTHETIIDGTSTQQIRADSAALNLGRWQNVRVLRNNTVNFSGVSDSVLFANFAVDSAPALHFAWAGCCSRRYGITPASGTLTVRNRLRVEHGVAVSVGGALTLVEKVEAIPGEDVVPPTPLLDGGELRVSGVMTTGAGSQVTVSALHLADPAGTTAVAGEFQPGTLSLVRGVSATLKPGLGYQNVTLTQGSRLVLVPGTVEVGGNLTFQDSSWVEMTNAADTLSVRGSMTMGTRDTRTGNRLSAGVLRLGGNLSATSRFSFATSGTHETIIDGTNHQSLRADSAALNLGRWQNVRVLRNNTVSFVALGSDSVLLANFRVDSAPELHLSYASCCGGRWAILPVDGLLTVRRRFRVEHGIRASVVGNFTLAARAEQIPGEPLPPVPLLDGGELQVSGVFTSGEGSNVTISSLRLADPSGTTQVNGLFSPSTVWLVGGVNATLKPGLEYQNVQLVEGSHAAMVTGTVTVSQALTLNDSSWIEMTDAGDTLSVRGSLTFGRKDTRTGSLLSAGVLRLGGSLSAQHRFSFAPSGTHETIIDGTTHQSINVDSVALNLGRWQNVRVLRNNQVAFNNATTINDSVHFTNFAMDSSPDVSLSGHSGRRYGLSPAGNLLTIRNRLDWNGRMYINGSALLIAKPVQVPGEPTVLTPTLAGPTAIIAGDLTTGSGSVVAVNNLSILGSSALSGEFSNATQVILSGGTSSPTAGSVYPNLVLKSGNRFIVPSGTIKVTGDLTIQDNSWIEMTDATDTLDVRGSVVFGAKDTRTGSLLSGGVLRVGGDFTADQVDSYAPSGTHETIIDGPTGTTQTISVDSASLNLGVWQNLRIAGRSDVRIVSATASGGPTGIQLTGFALDSVGVLRFARSHCSASPRRYIVTPASGSMTVRDQVTVDGSACGGTLPVSLRIEGDLNVAALTSGPAPTVTGVNGQLTIVGGLTTGAGSVFSAPVVTLLHASGTQNIAGTLSNSDLTFAGAGQAVKPGLAYGKVVFSGSATLGAGTYQFREGRVTSSGVLTVDAGAAASFYNFLLTLESGSQIVNNGSITYGTLSNQGAVISGSGTMGAGPP